MAKTSYFAIDPNGAKHTRTSARVYTHTVVYQSRLDDYLAIIPEHKNSAMRTAQWYLNCIALGYHQSLMHFPHYREDKERHAKDVKEAIEKLDGAKTAEEYAERVASRMRDKAQDKDWTIYHNAGWCGRYDLAQKLAAQVGGTILPAVKA